MQSNATFYELNRLKMLSAALEQILTKLREDQSFQEGFDNLLKLAQTPFVRSIIGDEFDMDQVEAVIHRIRTDPIVYDVITTIKNLLECFSVDRFEAFDTETELRKKAFELNQKRLFFAAIYFNETETENVSYKLHMDTMNTQPTIENKNRFWFPGPAGSMLLDMKYHRGFVQIKQAVDFGIIKHKKEKLKQLGLLIDVTEKPNPESSFSIKVVTDDNVNEGDNENYEDDDDDDDWFTDSNSTTTETTNSRDSKPQLITSLLTGGIQGLNNNNSTIKTIMDDFNLNPTDNPTLMQTTSPTREELKVDYLDSSEEDEKNLGVLKRQKRQSFFDFLLGFSDDANDSIKYAIDDLEFHTKQFPYPAYTEDEYVEFSIRNCKNILHIRNIILFSVSKPAFIWLRLYNAPSFWA